MLSKSNILFKDIILGNKFFCMRHRPAFCENWQDGNLLSQSIDESKNHADYLYESQTITLNFFEQVNSIVSTTIPIANKCYENFFLQSSMAEYNWKLSDPVHNLDEMKKTICNLEKQINCQNENISILLEKVNMLSNK